MINAATIRKKLSYGISVVLSLSSFFIIAKSAAQSTQLEYIYDLPQEKIVAHLDQYTVLSSTSETIDHKVTSHLWLLSGAYKVGTLSLNETQTCTISIKRILGDVKAVVYSTSKGAILSTSPNSTSVTLNAGSYDLYCIGKHFVGSVDFETPFHLTGSM